MLARRCLLKQPTLTRRLDRLCEQGLTERWHQNQDRRGVLVKLTTEGRARAKRYIDLARVNEAEILSDYSDGDVNRLKEMMRALIKNIHGDAAV